jgi:hypothetical protein
MLRGGGRRGNRFKRQGSSKIVADQRCQPWDAIIRGLNVWKGVLRVRSDLQRVLAEALKKPPITRSGAPSSADDLIKSTECRVRSEIAPEHCGCNEAMLG